MLFTKLNTGYFTFIARLIFTETVRAWETSTDGGAQGHRLSSLCSPDRETSWEAESGAKSALYLCPHLPASSAAPVYCSPVLYFSGRNCFTKTIISQLVTHAHVCCWWVEIFTWLKMNNVGKNTVDPFGAFWLLFKTFLASQFRLKVTSLYTFYIDILPSYYTKGGVWHDGA